MFETNQDHIRTGLTTDESILADIFECKCSKTPLSLFNLEFLHRLVSDTILHVKPLN